MKLNYKNTILVGLAFFSINAFWQLYEAVIPLILSQTFELKETLTGIIMAFDNILALFLLPLFGVISDRSSTRLGKRTPFIVIGTVLAVILMLFIPVADNTANFNLFIILLGAVLIAMCIYRSPAVALMPDITPKPLRSQANAVINLMGTLGTLCTLLLISVLVPKDGNPDYSVLFMSVAAIMTFSVIIMVMTIHENSLSNESNRINLSILNISKDDYENELPTESTREKFKNIKSDLMLLSEDVRKSLIYILCSVFLWFMAFNAISTAFSRYAVNVLGFKGGSYASVLLVAMVFATIGYIPMGYVSGRLGRKRTIITGIICMTCAYAVAVFFTHFSCVIYIIFAITGFGWSAINVNAYPMVVEMSSGKDIGKYTGLYYTFSTAAQIVTPVLSGFFLEKISYRALFPYATFFSVLSLLTMLKVKHGDSVSPEILKKMHRNGGKHGKYSKA